MNSITNHMNQQDQDGSTDHLEQQAEDIAQKKNHSRVTNRDREEAKEQMDETAPPETSHPSHQESGSQKGAGGSGA